MYNLKWEENWPFNYFWVKWCMCYFNFTIKRSFLFFLATLKCKVFVFQHLRATLEIILSAQYFVIILWQFLFQNRNQLRHYKPKKYIWLQNTQKCKNHFWTKFAVNWEFFTQSITISDNFSLLSRDPENKTKNPFDKACDSH